MIQSIYVKNFVLIDELSLDFDASFSVFTGETGAGKSLFIDALSILCGSRVSLHDIQQGKNEAIVEAQFHLKQKHPGTKILTEAGHELEDGNFVISRVFSREGKSIIKINNRPTTLAFVKDLMGYVIDIHSQHDSQYLLNNKNHLNLLDNFCNHEELLFKVKDSYKIYHQLKKSLDQMMKEEFNESDLDYYKFQLAEIESLNIQENELEQLEEIQKEMSNYEKRSSKMLQYIELLKTSNYEVLYEIQKELGNIDNKVLNEIGSEFASAYYTIEEQEQKLESYLNTLEFDEEVFHNNQQRIFDLHKIIRKHGYSMNDVFEKQEMMEKKIKLMDNREVYLEKQRKEIELAYNTFEKHSILLSKSRKLNAKKLELQIQEELSDLHLDKAQFKIIFDEDINQYGVDRIEFFISMNQGESLRPLTKIISGGELSRLMLGLKAIFTKLQHIETIVFDEIDTGVSGNVAYAIGKKMKDLAKDTQVISITHLAPVAAWADEHFLVEKEEVTNKTVSHIRHLNLDQRVCELASISSNSISDLALTAAKELYDSCRNDIN